MTRLALAVAAALAGGAPACGDDVGERCPQMRAVEASSSGGEDAGGAEVTRAEYSVAVETSAAFPCASSICVATPGRRPYCSRTCNGSGDCPEAFACRALLGGGPGAAKHCVWRECGRAADCGDADDFRCTPVPDPETGASVGQCGPR